MEKLLEQEAMMEEDQKVSHSICIYILSFCFLGQEATVDPNHQRLSRFHFLAFRFILQTPHQRIS